MENVVTQALSDRIPSTAALTETMRRRRASGGPAEQTFATLVGLELRPRKLREAAALWRSLLEASDVATRDKVWEHPDLLPDGTDLDAPAAFIDRVIGGDTSDIDSAIAELEKSLAAEAGSTEAGSSEAGDAEGGNTEAGDGKAKDVKPDDKSEDGDDKS